MLRGVLNRAIRSTRSCVTIRPCVVIRRPSFFVTTQHHPHRSSRAMSTLSEALAQEVEEEQESEDSVQVALQQLRAEVDPMELFEDGGMVELRYSPPEGVGV